FVDIEKVRIRRRHEPTVLVAEHDDEVVDAAGGEQIEIFLPVPLVEQPALEVRPMHGVHRDAALLEKRFFVDIADALERIATAAVSSYLLGDIERGIHQSARIGSIKDESRLTVIRSNATDDQRFSTRRQWC